MYAMQDKQAGLVLRTEQLEGKTYKNVFTGNQHTIYNIYLYSNLLRLIRGLIT